MRNELIKFKINSASQDDIYQHLLLCDDIFVPALSSRVDLREFAEKVNKRSEIFEAWDNGNLIGFLSCYYNDPKKLCGFITHVSVVSSYFKRGIASKLLSKCVDYGRTNGFSFIDLEVYKDNHAAVQLYEKYLFEKTGIDNDFLKMRKDIKSKENYE